MVKTREAAPWRLPESEWDGVGVYRHQPSGIPSHVARGDQHAADIIEGRYDLERARQDEARRRDLVTQIEWGRRADRPPTTADVFRRQTGED